MRPPAPLLVFLSVALDALSTSLGLSVGLAESGPLASRLLAVLGVAYFAVEAAVLYGLYLLLRLRLPRDWAALAVAVGPWLAGWRNLGLAMRLLGGLGVG